MTATSFVKQQILEELKQGNMDALKDLPPIIAMECGIALQNEVGQQEVEQLNSEALGKTMLERMADTGIKEQIIKRIEEEKKGTS